MSGLLWLCSLMLCVSTVASCIVTGDVHLVPKTTSCNLEKGLVVCSAQLPLQHVSERRVLEHSVTLKLKLPFGDFDRQSPTPVCLRLSEAIHRTVSWSQELGIPLNDSWMHMEEFHIIANHSAPVGQFRLNGSCFQASSDVFCRLQDVHLLRQLVDLFLHPMNIFVGPETTETLYQKELGGTVVSWQLRNRIPSLSWNRLPPPGLMRDLRQLTISGAGNALEAFVAVPMVDLEAFSFTNSFMVDVDKGVFQRIPNLKYLDLSRNSLQNVPSEMVLLKSLKSLDLSDNPIDLSSVNRMSLPTLESLTIHDISVRSLNRAMQAFHVENLTMLNARSCEVWQWDNDSLLATPKLQSLDLSHNKLESIPANVFARLTDLRHVDLSHNLITSATCIRFTDQQRLMKLDLSHNRLSSLLAGIMASGQVESLNLSHNNIESWRNGGLISGDSVRVREVDLSDNKISTLPIEMRDSLSDVPSVILNVSRIRCPDCDETEAFVRWLQEHGTFVGSFVSYLDCLDDGGVSRTIIRSRPDCASAEVKVSVVIWGIIGIFCSLLILAAAVGCYAYRNRAVICSVVNYARVRRHMMMSKPPDDILYENDVFIFCSHLDREWVTDQLVWRLQSSPERYKVNLHEPDFPLDTLTQEHVEECMGTSRYVVAVLSDNFFRSQLCRREMDVANVRMLVDDREFLILIERKGMDIREVPSHQRYLVDTRTIDQFPDNPTPAQWRGLRKALGESNYVKERRLARAQAAGQETIPLREVKRTLAEHSAL